MNMSSMQFPHPPFKNVATALLFGAILGPIGLLYGSFWGGFSLIFIDLLAITNKFMFVIVLIQIISCIWSVGAVEAYNKNLLESIRNS
jgi:hypothetical protein